MKVTPLAIADVLLIEPDVHSDARGYFFESYNAARLNAALARTPQFVQDNHSRSVRHVVRGLHYQIRRPQAKLVRVAAGAIFDVAVDLRRSSPTFGKWTGAVLSADNKRQLWVPEGFAHGFMVLTDVAETLYKATDYYAPEYERCIIWNDPCIGIDWPDVGEVILSDKDKRGAALKDADTYD
ncbi:dTDP-4-dehydrorhamnose 3,5-epimerase [Bordetella genomosp. 7]|uniref:dTDP-4-dehydrorhamnose 3,5-epimerase n=1 Tax=Bordetella genomosp. 7 TaxID=1416805 RepID=A0A261QVV3_9BORD|nr:MULTISPECIES: dTDP-4-dehydrorhamnose 3,5-epimerase [Bordetella]OZI15770.1 dTDP-4-dehydrorhamnose 3,5-epimerase [Bordetella genomosp. 7]OZI16522.1 dTDP-4-dehydrorhamnose 3,5-epimerase [Bordetella genomosp. 7]